MGKRNRIIPKFDAGFGQNAVGGGFNLGQAFFAHDVIGGNGPLDIGARQARGCLAGGILAGLTAAAAAATGGGCVCGRIHRCHSLCQSCVSKIFHKPQRVIDCGVSVAR